MSNVIPHEIGYYIGITFADKGRSVETGLDCWGLVRYFFGQEFNIQLPSYIGFYKDTRDRGSLNKLIADEALDWDKIPVGQGRFGDVVVMTLSDRPIHVGLVIVPGLMLHIEKGLNSCLERYDSVRWKDRIYGIYRHAHVAKR